jgi:hypothetical protein
MPNAIEQIYDQLMQVFGGTDDSQIFTMQMPGTTLDAKSYSYDTSNMKPAIVQEAESRLTDQMFDIAKVSGSSNGERVSSQYLQALSVLIPNFNPLMPMLKKTMRDFLNSPVPANTFLDDKPFTGTLQEYYFKLYENWIAVKLAWEKQIIDKKTELSKNPATENELYLEWYEQIAEAELAKIDEAMGKVLGVFSPSDMDAILGALASGPGGEIQEASNTVKDIQLASPDGGYFYPVDLTPDDWFLDLASDINPVDLLQDPQFIANTISARRQALQASISQIQGMLVQMPTQGDLKKAADDLALKQKTYTDAQNNLLNTYADNTATAVEMYLSKHQDDSEPQSPEDALKELDTNAVNSSRAKNEQPQAKTATKKDTSALTPPDVQALLAGQINLIGAQSALLTSSQELAGAGMNLASEQAAYFGDLPVILARQQSQLADIQNMQDQLNMAINNPSAPPTLQPILSSADVANIVIILKAVNTAATAAEATPTSVDTAVVIPTGSAGTLTQIKTDSTAAANAPGATVSDVVVAITNAANTLQGAPSAKKSDTSQRFMELQLSFSAEDMLSSASSDTSFTQTSWGVDVFFGSASGSSSSSSAVTTKNSIDNTTEIKVGLKAAKVDIERGWLDPGIFKLTADMSRISTDKVCNGPMVYMTDPGTKNQIIDWTSGTIDAYNQTIMPSVPVSFLVVKDVTISFKATSSQLSAIHTVLDSKSAVGGGFLCFSASKSSASHSDSSSLSTKTQDNVITISMPGPQILGWFLEMMPQDSSTQLTPSSTAANGDINIISFVQQLAALSSN